MKRCTEHDIEFLSSAEGRPARIMLEFLEAKDRLEKNKIFNTIVMFGSARILTPQVAQQKLQQAQATNNTAEITKAQNALEISKYYTITSTLANKFANHFKNLPPENKFYVCSGGGPGIMEAANKGAFEANEKTIGFNIVLPFEQHANPYLQKELTFDFTYFFLRKFWFSYLAKAFVVFPGGFGTMDELFEVITLIQTGKMKKHVPIVLFGKEFFESFLNIQLLEKYGLISTDDKNMFLLTDDVDEAFNYVIERIKDHNHLDI